jgi:hypothetical protein
MQTILRILERAGGYRPTLYLKIENPPYMALVIEAAPEPGPLNLPTISVAHYGEQNGDLMRDPEMCLELDAREGGHLSAFYFRNDYLGMEQWSRFVRDAQCIVHAELYQRHEEFARMWDENLRVQGFLEATTDKSILG